jgi:hypothetical protein
MSLKTILTLSILFVLAGSSATDLNLASDQVTILACYAMAEEGVPTDLNDCALNAQIEFDDSSVEEIFRRPERILSDPERFWRDNKTYRLVGMWHNSSRAPIPREDWKRQIGVLAELGSEERRCKRNIHPELPCSRGVSYRLRQPPMLTT